MKVLLQEEPRTVGLMSTSHTITFSQMDAGGSPKVEVQLHANSEISRETGYRTLINREVFGCLGLINVAQQIYLAVITGASATVARPLPYESVDKIYSVDFVSLSSSEWDYVNLDSSGMPVQLSEDEYDPVHRVVHPCFEFKKLLSSGTFYFSNDFDLTSLLQNRGVDQRRLHQTDREEALVNVQHYDEKFMWNSFLMDELIKFRSNLDKAAVEILNQNRFLTTVIRGFAKTVRLPGTQGDTISIISKQSWKRAGTRFNARGIDDHGYVANFVETEFIFHNASSDQIFAFTQVRGSVPAFWEQDSTLINPKITVTRSREATQPSFDKHFTELCNKYSACHIVNLLSKTKPSEAEISRRYLELLQKSDHRHGLRYSHFDFHAETKPSSGGFAGATKILAMLRESLESFGWFDYDSSQGEVLTRQNGVFRVNCLDCLDRTNLIEQVICQSILESIVKTPSNNSTRDRMRLEMLSAKHNELWADNGDAISQIYTGTNALKSSFSRSGKMNIAGALSDVTKSMSRMYQNTFVDSKKQSTIDIFLGKDGRNSIPVQIFDPMNEYVTEKLAQTEASFTTYSDMTMFTGTFNVNAGSPMAHPELVNWLYPPENANLGCPDIYAIGLQELIELNAGSILAADSSKPTQWAQILNRILNSQQEEYLLLRTESIASMCLFFFVKKSQISHVTQVSGSSKKTGLGGMTANKGACAVRFEYGATSFAMVTSHLAAGVGATMERYNDYIAIMQGLSFARNYAITDHDNIVWFGDLNYRINLPNDKCRYLIENGAFDELHQYDQLAIGKKDKGGPFAGFREERVLFYPTYKFDRGTSNYDTSEKQRVPSWTDRVLYRSTKPKDIQALNYNSVMDITISDHKPVFSTFKCRVKFIDEDKKSTLSHEFINKYKASRGERQIVSNDSGSTTASTASSTFTQDALSDLNLLDFDAAPPKLPARAPTAPAQSLPRKIPPPPMSRKTAPVDSFASLKLASREKLEKPAERSSTDLAAKNDRAPPPPPSRTPTHLASLAFNSAPMTPSSSGTPRTMSPVSAKSPPPQAASGPLRPLKPLKPNTLSSAKIETEEAPVPKESTGSTEVKTPPAPPPRAKPNGNGMAMSDWKPLVPQ